MKWKQVTLEWKLIDFCAFMLTAAVAKDDLFFVRYVQFSFLRNLLRVFLEALQNWLTCPLGLVTN